MVGIHLADFGMSEPVHLDNDFSDQLRGIGTKDVGTKDLIGFGISEDFYHAAGFVHGVGAAVGFKGEAAYFIGDALFIEFC